MILNKWLDESKQILTRIKEQEPKDRLEYVSALDDMNLALARSVNGWIEWLINPQIMSKLTEEELREVYERFKPITISFLELDIWITEKKMP